MREFGELIRETRERRGIRAYDLAYALKQTPSWLSRLETGGATHPPSPSVMDAITESLGLNSGEMFAAMGYRVGNTPSANPPMEPIRRELIERLTQIELGPERIRTLESVLDNFIWFDRKAGETVDHESSASDHHLVSGRE